MTLWIRVARRAAVTQDEGRAGPASPRVTATRGMPAGRSLLDALGEHRSPRMSDCAGKISTKIPLFSRHRRRRIKKKYCEYDLPLLNYRCDFCFKASINNIDNTYINFLLGKHTIADACTGKSRNGGGFMRRGRAARPPRARDWRRRRRAFWRPTWSGGKRAPRPVPASGPACGA